MDDLNELLPLLLTFGLIYSVALFPFAIFAVKEIRWSREAVAAGPTLFVTVRSPQPTSIQRWIARTIRRKNAPDEDADRSSPY